MSKKFDLPEQAYIEFKEIFEKEYQKEITMEEARQMADDYFDFLSTAYEVVSQQATSKN